ncbi:MAG TPA: response regulator [Candidatus Krumholzibacteria bacterium]|nr:response regulator [Candidatus Krumholzibacteria bacterium]
MDAVRVLLVDDERDIVDTVKYSLELRGFDVDVAYDGETALKKARAGGYALVLLDVMLPGRNGYEVSRVLKDDIARGDVTPFKIMLITARKLDNAIREEFVATWSKADACLYKPFDLEALLDRMTQLLEPMPTL